MSIVLDKYEYYYIKDVFSNTFIHKHSKVISNTKNIWSKLINKKTITYKDILEVIYKNCSENYPFEYIYKNCLLHYFIKKMETQKNKWSVITEIKVGDAKADFLFVNGHSEVFEIKTPLDNLSRLKYQLEAYFKVFDKVSIFVDTRYIGIIKKQIPEMYNYLGIYVMKNNEIYCKQKSKKHNFQFDYTLAFNMFRKQEYIDIIKNEKNVDLSNLGNVQQAVIAYKLFQEIPFDKAKIILKKILKKRCPVNLNSIKKYPNSISLLLHNAKSTKELKDFENILNKKLGV